MNPWPEYALPCSFGLSIVSPVVLPVSPPPTMAPQEGRAARNAAERTKPRMRRVAIVSPPGRALSRERARRGSAGNCGNGRAGYQRGGNSRAGRLSATAHAASLVGVAGRELGLAGRDALRSIA